MSRESRIYVGNLPHDITRRDLDDLFYKYGNIRDIDLKNRRTPYYAFIDFEDYRDADDAVKGRNNYSYEGYRLKVEKTRGNGRFGGGGRLVGGHYVPGRPTGPPSKRTNYRVLVEGLPPSGSWQDLKDHMRECGDVCYADVYRDGTGVVEYNCYEDVRQAVKYLHDTKFISHERETSYIRVRDDSRRSRSRSSSSRSRSRSRSRRSRSRSRRSRSRSRSRSKSRDRRSRSDSRDRRSRSKSRDRRSRSKSRDRRSRSRSRDRRSGSKSRDRRSKSNSRDRRSKSKSHDRRSKSKSRSKSRSPRRSRSRS